MPTIRTFFLALLLCCTNLAAVGIVAATNDSDELLPEDQAFAFSAELMPDNTIEVSWSIADGYYMYQDKMGYEVIGDTTLTSAVKLPKGKPKHDELFGDVEVYTGIFKLSLPIQDPTKPFTLLATGQGCNEPVGVCYPPITHEIPFDGVASVSSAIIHSSPRLTSEGLVGLRTLDQQLDSISGLISRASSMDSTVLSDPIEEPATVKTPIPTPPTAIPTSPPGFELAALDPISPSPELNIEPHPTPTEVTPVQSVEPLVEPDAYEFIADGQLIDSMPNNASDTGDQTTRAGVTLENASGSQPSADTAEVTIETDLTPPPGIEPDNSSQSSMQSSASDIPESIETAMAIDTPQQGPEPEQTPALESSSELDSVAQLRELLSSGFEQPEFLDVEQAFKFSVTDVDADRLSANFEIAEGYYLYQNKLDFIGAGGASVGDTLLPEPKIKEDQFFGRTPVYNKSFSVPVLLDVNSSEGNQMTLEASYQGCAEQGICYPPVTKIVNIELPGIISAARAESVSSNPPGSTSSSSLEKQPVVPDKTLFNLLVGAFIAGILLTFTPCVLPLIPILSGIIAGQGEKLTRMRGGSLALIYVLGTTVTYAAMGAIAGATGEQLQAYFQNVWAIGILAFIFVLMALSMFGLYQIQVPAAIQSRLQSGTTKFSGSIPLVFLLGLVSALIVGACVSPVLISFLGLAVTRADPVLGAQMMVSMALGMGLPLIALGFGAGYLIPRAGVWMESVKHLFGVMLIAVAIYLLGALPEVPVLLLWGVLFIILSSYLGSSQLIPDVKPGWQALRKGVGTLLLVWGIAALIGGFYGQRDILQPLPETLFQDSDRAAPTSSSEEFHLFTRVSTLEDIDQQFSLAASQNKRIMLDFYADWCTDCIKMEKSTFQDPAILNTLQQGYLTLQVDVTDPNDPGPRAIKKKFAVFGPPAVLFFDPDGKTLEHKNFYGYRNSADFLKLISN